MIALRQMFRHITPRRTLHAAAVAVAVFFTPFGTAEADAGNLEGSWSGNGQVIFPPATVKTPAAKRASARTAETVTA